MACKDITLTTHSVYGLKGRKRKVTGRAYKQIVSDEKALIKARAKKGNAKN